MKTSPDFSSAYIKYVFLYLIVVCKQLIVLLDQLHVNGWYSRENIDPIAVLQIHSSNLGPDARRRKFGQHDATAADVERTQEHVDDAMYVVQRKCVQEYVLVGVLPCCYQGAHLRLDVFVAQYYACFANNNFFSAYICYCCGNE